MGGNHTVVHIGSNNQCRHEVVSSEGKGLLSSGHLDHVWCIPDNLLQTVGTEGGRIGPKVFAGI